MQLGLAPAFAQVTWRVGICDKKYLKNNIFFYTAWLIDQKAYILQTWKL